MNYSPFLTLAARLETAYTKAQDWISNDAPAVEQSFKQSALKATVTGCEAALDFIDVTLPIWITTIRLFCVRADQCFIRGLIKAHRFNERHQIAHTIAHIWSRKGALATAVMDRLFYLDVQSTEGIAK